MNLTFVKLAVPTQEIAAALEKWENDPSLISFIHPNRTQAGQEKREPVTVDSLKKRLENRVIFLIYLQAQLVGEMNYQVDPGHLYKKEPGTAWIGINIGEESARGKGVGMLAMKHLEEQIKARGLQRIELGVFEFNKNAIRLYKKMGYQEIGRIKDFTFWQDRLWQDIRMEKYLK